MASYSSSVSYSNSYMSDNQFESVVTGSDHKTRRYYFYCVTWWDGESDVRVYETFGSLSGSTSGGVTTATFYPSSVYIRPGETYTIHWMWGTSAGSTVNLDSLSDYQYYNTKTYEHVSGTTYSLILDPSSGISSFTGYLSTDYQTVTVDSRKTFKGLSAGDYFYIESVSYETNYSYPVYGTAASGSGTFTIINSRGSWSDHKVSITNSNRICAITATYSPPATYTITAAVTPTGKGVVTGAGTKTAGDAYSLTATPISHYHFLYWTGDGDYSTDNPITGYIYSNLHFVANFEEDSKYTVTYNPNYGSASKSSDTEYYGTYVTLPSASMDPESEPAYRYTITFDPREGTVSPTSRLTQCTVTTTYSLAGWYTSRSGGTYKGTAGSSYKITSTTTLYAHWNSSRSYTDSKLTSLPTPTRSGYRFDGWYTSASGGTKVTTNTVFTSDQTIYAHWTRTQFTVTMYYLYGSTIISSTGTTVVNSGDTFYINSHIKSITGYEYSYSIPSSNFTVTEDTEVNYYYVPYSESPTINVDSATFYSLSINVSVSSQSYARTVEITCGGVTESVNIPSNQTVSETYTFGSTQSPLSSGSGYTVTAVVKYGSVPQGSTNRVCYTNFNFTGFGFVVGDPITMLTYTDWNLFRTYLTGKCSRYSVTYIHSPVSQGDTLYAVDYNSVIQAFLDIGFSAIETVAPKVLSGDNVKAYPFSVFKSYLNSNDN